MQCVVCKHDNDRVVDSRSCEDGSAIRRRRECLSCHRRFTTYERAEVSLRAVIKKDGRREPFQREKVLIGLRTACQKRPISVNQLEAIVDRIESGLFGESDREVSSQAVGEKVMEELKALDKVAYLRFASVYREFADVMEFARVIMPFLPTETSKEGTLSMETLSAEEPPVLLRKNLEGGIRAAYRGAVQVGSEVVVKSEWRKDYPKKDGRNGTHPGGP